MIRLALVMAPTKSRSFCSSGSPFAQDPLPPITLMTNGQHSASAKRYLAPDAQPLRQDTRHRILAPMTPGAFYVWLPHFLAPGASGETVAIHYSIWTLVAIQPSLPCFLTQLTIPSHPLIHYLFSLHIGKNLGCIPCVNLAS